MSKSTQRDLVLNALKGGPKTMWQLTTDLRILRPGARIFELRKKYWIDSDFTEVQGRKVIIYTYRGPKDAPPSEHERTETVLTCAECGQGVVRKRKARPLKPNEKPFCSDTHRAAYGRRKNQQPDLFAGVA